MAPAAPSDAVHARSAKVSTGPAGSGPGRGGISAGRGPKAGLENSSGSRAAQAERPAWSSSRTWRWWVSSVSGASGPMPMPWTSVLTTARLTSVTGLGNRASIAPRILGTPLMTATAGAADFVAAGTGVANRARQPVSRTRQARTAIRPRWSSTASAVS